MEIIELVDIETGKVNSVNWIACNIKYRCVKCGCKGRLILANGQAELDKVKAEKKAKTILCSECEKESQSERVTV
jgi:hypothetical protein